MAAARVIDVQEAFRAVVRDFGVEKLAALLGMPAGTLHNKINLNETSHHKALLSEAVLVTILSKDTRILEAFARMVGHVTYSLPSLHDLTTDSLLSHMVKMHAEQGDFHQRLQDSLKSDNGISAKEYKAIAKEAHEWIASILEILHRLGEMSQ
jgi:hypothetical protein